MLCYYHHFSKPQELFHEKVDLFNFNPFFNYVNEI